MAHSTTPAIDPSDLSSSALMPGQLLWHYTDYDGLKGILDGQLWASSLSYLNDTLEFRYAVSIALEVLKVELSAIAEKTDLSRFATLQSRLERFFKDIPGRDVFITSFSEEPDDLSQWRAYGKGSGPSFAIGFDPRALEITAETSGKFALEKVRYGRTEVQMALHALLRAAIDEVIQQSVGEDSLTPAHATIVANHLGPAIANALLQVAPRYKHGKFSDEKEWRLIRRLPVISTAPELPLQFRKSGSLIVPYVEFKIHEKGADPLHTKPGDQFPASSPIAEITIGPTPHRDELRHAIEEMVSRKGLYLQVSQSEVPFRNW